jgi:hypothetical protein
MHDPFKGITQVYGMTLPGIPQARLVKSRTKHNPRFKLVHILDIETDLYACAFTLEQAQKDLAEELLAHGCCHV